MGKTCAADGMGLKQMTVSLQRQYCKALSLLESHLSQQTLLTLVVLYRLHM